jgi:hypothetical protein
METQNDHLDYGIYIDARKAFIAGINEFNSEQPVLLFVEQNPDATPESPEIPTPEELRRRIKAMQTFARLVIAHIDTPHRVLIFGPTQEKYELHKAMQRDESLTSVIKELKVADTMEFSPEAQAYTEKYYARHRSF